MLLNNLNNVIIIQKGLSNNIGTFKATSTSFKYIFNSGGIAFKKSNDTNDGIMFDTIDNLINIGVIKHKVGCIHLDVEGMEEDAIEGGQETIKRDLPYLSIENNGCDIEKKRFSILHKLPNEYQFQRRIRENDVYNI